MQKLVKLAFLFNCLLSILTLCPDSPTLPSSSIPAATPFKITPTSAGMSNFPSSTRQLSLIISLTPDETCTSGRFYLFTLTITPSGTETEIMKVYIDCSDLTLYRTGDWPAVTSSLTVFSASLTSISLFYTFDLSTNAYKAEHQSSVYHIAASGSSSVTQSWNFDSTTKLYLCSQKAGVSAKACKVSDVKLIYSYFGTTTFPYAHLGGTAPTLAAFYPLLGLSGLASPTSLESSFGTASSGYFGDSSSSPTAGTPPSWDSTNAFVKMTSAGQFLTFPLPSLQSGSITTTKTFSVSAWIRITSIPGSQATIFATHKADGTEIGYKLVVTSSSNAIDFYASSTQANVAGTRPTITRNTWQLVGFDVYLRGDSMGTFGTMYIDTSSTQFYLKATSVDLTTPTLLRVNSASNSFIGDVSALRFMTPGGGFTTSSSPCLTANSIELGTNSFALKCSGSNALKTADSKCSSSCPTGSFLSIGTAVSLCIPCPTHCATCDSTQCLTCNSNYFLYEKACITPCPSDTYVSGSTCIDCPTHCATCDSTQCLTCDLNYFLHAQACSSFCPSNTYYSQSTCASCPSNCAVCEDNTQCLVCETNYFFYNGACVNTCPSRMYSTGSICANCPTHCATCDKTQCLTCDSSYRLYNKACVTPCPSNTYDSGSACIDCPTHCATCDSTQCLTCDSSYSLYNKICVDQCPTGMYSKHSTCTDCPDNCAQCNKNECQVCASHYELDDEGGCILAGAIQSSFPAAIVWIISGCCVLAFGIFIYIIYANKIKKVTSALNRAGPEASNRRASWRLSPMDRGTVKLV